MDGIDTLQSSAPETKAERIARYKAERRRELAERYGNTDEFTSKYVRRDRKVGDASEAVSSSGSKEKEKHEDNGPEQTYTRRGLRSKASDDEPGREKDGTSRLKTDVGPPETASSFKTSSHFRLRETDDTEEPKVDVKPADSTKRTSKMSLLKDPEGTGDGGRGRRAGDDGVKRQAMSSDEEESSASLLQTNKSKVMDEKEAEEQRERAAAVEEEEPSSLRSDKALPLSKNRDASPPPSSPPPHQPASLQRQDSGPRGIKGILKKSRSTSVESDHSEGSAPEGAVARQSSITLSHPESEE